MDKNERRSAAGHLIIMKKYDLSVLNLKDLILFLLQRIDNSAVDSAYARAGMHFANGMLQCRMNLSEILVSNGESDEWRDGAHDIVSGYCGITGDGLYGSPAFIIPYLVLYYFIHHYLAVLFYCAAGHILFK